MTVRLARADDCARLPDIQRSAGRRFADHGMADVADDALPGPDQWEPFCVNETLWVAVDAADRPVGFLAAGVQGDALFIYELAVGYDQQGEGHGTALMAAAEARARALGLGQVILTTFRHVAWNAPFYAHLGYELAPDRELPLLLQPVMSAERRRWSQPDRERCAMRKRLSL